MKLSSSLPRLLTAIFFMAVVVVAQTSFPYFGRGVWRGNVVDFRIVDGWAIVEGDIVAGRASDLTARYQQLLSADTAERKQELRESIVVADQARLWPEGVVPYEVDPVLKNTAQIEAAIQHWNLRTNLKIVPRNGEANYVRVTPYEDPTACASSSVGMRGGMQLLFASETCGANILIHEIGHVVGLSHEQARSDRNGYVRLFWENMAKPALSQFGVSTPSTDYGPYDYYSVMHYRSGDFSKNGAVTIETRPAGIPIGQSLILSDGDIDAVNRLYGSIPRSITISTTPPGLQLIVDGERVTAPRSFDWAPDSTHTIEAPALLNDANGRYEYARWSDNGARTHSVNIKPEATTLYTANYVRYNKFELRVTPENAGTVRQTSAAPDGLPRDDTFVVFTAVPAPGYVFAHWTGPFIEHNINLTNLPINPVAFSANGDLQGLTARFVPAPTAVPAGPNLPLTRFHSILNSGDGTTAPLRVDGRLYNTPVAFTWEVGSKHEVEIASLFPVTGDRSLRTFQSWNDGVDRVRQVIAGDQAITYTATYGIQYAVFPATVGPGRVQLSPESSTFYFDRDATVDLSAAATEGSQFVGWGADLSGNQNPKTVVMRESIQPIAFFGSTTSVSAFGIMNAARQRPNTEITGTSIIGKISPGEVITINMPGVGPDAQIEGAPDADGVMPSRVGDTRVLAGGVAVPVISAAKGQVTAFVPYGASVVQGRFIPVQIEYLNRTTGAGGVLMAPANPAIYTADGSGSGSGRITNESGLPNSPDAPARRGSVVTFFATGLGVTSPAGSDDRISAAAGPVPKGELEVRIGGAIAEVISAGIAPNQLGVHRIEARVPAGARTGNTTPLILTLDGAPSQFDVTIAVQ